MVTEHRTKVGPTIILCVCAYICAYTHVYDLYVFVVYIIVLLMLLSCRMHRSVIQYATQFYIVKLPLARHSVANMDLANIALLFTYYTTLRSPFPIQSP